NGACQMGTLAVAWANSTNAQVASASPRQRCKLKILQRKIRRKRGKHCARIRFEDNNGKIHEIMRTADNKSAAKTRLAQLEAEILEKGTARFEAGKVTVRPVAEYG